jgi:dinuclear metal center YbgI/SA1388 family protein
MQNMKISEIIDYLHQIAPPHFQENYDNSGLLVGKANDEVNSAIISLDCTEEVVDEAIQAECSLIISHHPIVFRGLKRFNGSNYVERVVMKAIKHEIALFAIHTNLDNVFYHGVNTRICERLELKHSQILRVNPSLSVEGNPAGAGMVGQLDGEIPTEKFLHFLRQKMELSCIKHTALTKDKIKKVAVCGGSGSFLLQDAIAMEADIFITADFKYHEFFDAEHKIIIADIGHYESEKFTIDLLYDLISNKFPNFAARKSCVNTNPVRYFYTKGI